ncbi:MAG: hypothetical protein KatS3mg110_3761 [Pirellulaceae bacterium]|nr:MAG: hypothetical protein KatS3mg110_3761 [Pirellulaceae bacterium]
MYERRLPGWGWLLLSAHVFLLIYIAWAHSPVLNEEEYLPAGISHWKTGIFEPSCRNPPLSRLVGALPVLLLRHTFRPETVIPDPDSNSAMFLMSEFLTDNQKQLRWLYFVGRLGCIPFSILGGVICYRWATELFGRSGGVVALLLWCVSPEILANNALIMPDNVAASLGVWAAYRFRHWLREPRWPNSLWAGVALGWTLLAKAPWMVLLFLFPVLWLLSRSYRVVRPVNAFIREFGQLSLIYIVAFLLINATYGFDGSFLILGKYPFRSSILSGIPRPKGEEGRPAPISGLGNRFVDWHLGWVPVPLPKLYVLGMDLQAVAVERRAEKNYLFGRWNENGWWYYYFAAALVKFPLGIWGLSALAILAAIFTRSFRCGWKEELWLLAPVLVWMLFLIGTSTISRHFRYALPVLPFLFIAISRVARPPVNKSENILGGLRMGITMSLLSATIVSSLAVYPHSMSYFNEAVGGPNNGYKYLLGSNLDRGQDRYYLQRWQRAHPGLPDLQSSDPYLRNALGPTPRKNILPAGWYAVSVNSLLEPESPYRVLWGMQPVARVAYTTWIYYVPQDIRIDSVLDESQSTTAP